jgi:hypothetical protein
LPCCLQSRRAGANNDRVIHLVVRIR